MKKNVIEILEENKIKYKIKNHKNEVFTCELAAKERGCKISQIVKTMIGKDSFGNYHICIIPGNKILKIKKVREHAGGIKIDLLDPDKIREELDLVVGAISPLIFPKNTFFYIDFSILDEEFINMSSGNPKYGVEILSKDLIKILNGKICDIISSKF